MRDHHRTLALVEEASVGPPEDRTCSGRFPVNKRSHRPRAAWPYDYRNTSTQLCNPSDAPICVRGWGYPAMVRSKPEEVKAVRQICFIAYTRKNFKIRQISEEVGRRLRHVSSNSESSSHTHCSLSGACRRCAPHTPSHHTHTHSLVNHPPPKGNEVLQLPSLHNSCSLTRNINTSQLRG